MCWRVSEYHQNYESEWMHLKMGHILYPVSHIFVTDPAMIEVLVIDQEKKILKTEHRSVIDENEYSLDRIAIAVDSDGKCYLNLDDVKSSKSWKCNLTCKTFCSEDIQSIIDLKNEFSDESVETAREILQCL